MAEVATVNQIVQIGVEPTPGGTPTAWKELPALSIEPNAQAEPRKFRPAGGKFTTLVGPGKEWSEAKISTEALCYNHIVYLLAGMFGYTVTQKGTDLVYDWVFTPKHAEADAIKTFSVKHGDALNARSTKYGFLSEAGFTFSRSGIAAEGTMIGQALTWDATLEATTTPVPVVPMDPGQVTVSLDTTSAGLGVTKLNRVFEYGWKVGDKANPVWPLDGGGVNYPAHVEIVPSAQVTMTMAADTQMRQVAQAMRQGGRFFQRLEAVGPTIASTTHKYGLVIDTAISTVEIGDFADSDGVFALEFTLDMLYDAVWAKPATIKVTNTLAAL